ncbi:hypothetical protein N7530_006446 [Penicillium desertorum]|uniref:J domain-containing protein n=1 Tax=Penicillium desertorum TaxID=1303715 RepID=A0A9X0BM63_9EURO|nr:hypothetical protein N7530_006446 [Penicillium desertorum]
MGQFHSSQASSTPEQSDQKTDYYELLGVTRGATDEEIKKAYRKKALVLHPDRNYGNVDEATKLFAEIQSAYEVLADPQERAWYDSHSDAFLGTNGNTDDQHSSVLGWNSSDSPTGFFGGLREQFEQLMLEERLACQWENQDPIEYPSFGSAGDNFETVVRPFYAAWTGFSTQKSFAWKDAHRYSEAPDRRVRRMMEKENRRLREEGIREFNDAVRSLVAFVKKRDPRYKINAQSEAQRQETLRKSVAAQAARSRAVNQAKMRDHVVPDWAQSEQPVADDEDRSEESEVESFECVACHKYFKSQKQFEAHERSKKHLKAVKQLCWEMRMQNDELDLESGDDLGTNAVTSRPLEADEGEDEVNAAPEVDLVLDASLRSHHVDVEDRGSSHGLGETTPLSELSSPTSSHDDDYASREYVETRLRADMDSLSTGAGDSSGIPDHPLSSDLAEQPPTLKMGKAKQKRAKKAAKQADQPTGFICANCQAPFTSKSRLFDHIRELRHEQPLGSVAKKGRKR